MEVYIELTYLINGFILMVVFEMMAILLNVDWQIKKVMLYSFLCNISVFVIYINNFPYLSLIIWLLVFYILFHKQTFLYYPIYLIVYFSVLFFVKSLIMESFIYNGILITPTSYFDLTVIIVCIFFSIIQMMFFVYTRRKITNQSYSYDIEIEYLGHHYCMTGFLDSGNEAFYQGYPLIFFKKDQFLQYHVIDQIKIDPGSVDVEIIQIDILMINHQKLKGVYAGLITSIQYDCLLNKQLMGGII